MLINPKVVKNFFNRKLANYDWLKKEKPKDIQRALKELKPRPDFGEVKLWLHQKACFLILVYLKRFMLFLDPGGGKTLLTLMLIKYRKQRGEKPKALVFVPYVITTETWIEETAQWTDLKCVPLTGTIKQNREAILKGDGDLYVIAYQSAVAMIHKKVEGKWKVTAEIARNAFKDFDMLVMDECQKLGNIHSTYYIMCRAISKKVDWVIGLTGTPFGRNVEKLWSQMYLIDLGETLGETLGFFRGMFFRETNNYWSGGFEYKFKKKMKSELMRMIKNVSIRYKINEFHDMPPKKYIKKYVKSTDAIAGYYDKIVESLENLSFGQIKYKEIESNFIKLRQLSSGFMTLKGDDSSKVEIEFPENPKLDALQELVEGIPPEAKMIIFHDFVYTNQLISKRLKKMKIPHARVWGKGKNNVKELRRFKRDPKCRILVINSQSGSSSQNLQMANYVVYFEQPRGSIDREQSERRAWRPGQKKRVFFIDLFMLGTYDENMFNSNAEGTNLMKGILDGKKKFKRINKQRKVRKRLKRK